MKGKKHKIRIFFLFFVIQFSKYHVWHHLTLALGVFLPRARAPPERIVAVGEVWIMSVNSKQTVEEERVGVEAVVVVVVVVVVELVVWEVTMVLVDSVEVAWEP